jgi:CBS domain-containing protein
MMVQCDCGAIPVVDPQTQAAVGIVTDRDIICRAVAEGENPIGMQADQVMSLPVTSVGPEATLEDCLSRMEMARVRRMLVVDDRGQLCGMVAQADIARMAPARDTAELVKDVSLRSPSAAQ